MNTFNHNLVAANVAGNLNSHYEHLATSVKRLSSGLRINSAADDAAGLGIRELMRADIAAMNQGARNASDAISMIQVADGALGIIDEKLVRMKELAEQASTGTYDSTQRLMIDSEFQAMASEIDRIARATDFNGIKLLDGSRQGSHDGSKLDAAGALKVHFGTGNDSAEDYYYLEINDCTLTGLGLRDPVEANMMPDIGKASSVDMVTYNKNSVPIQTDTYGNVPILSDLLMPGDISYTPIDRGVGLFSTIAVGIIPAGTTGIQIDLRDDGLNDTIQIFTRSGKHLVGTTIDRWTKCGGLPYPEPSPVDPNDFLNEAYGFLPGATYNNQDLNGGQGNLIVDYDNPIMLDCSSNGMNIEYSGDGNDINTWPQPYFTTERLKIDIVTEDLIIIIPGWESFRLKADWTYMPSTLSPPDPGPDNPQPPDTPDPGPDQPDVPTPEHPAPQGDIISIKTQEKAQKALTRINDAIVIKDKVRANLGAMQNRLENTVANLMTMAENLQASESRISDADVGLEMTEFVRNQILTQSAVAMLAQANSYPHMLNSLING